MKHIENNDVIDAAAEGKAGRNCLLDIVFSRHCWPWMYSPTNPHSRSSREWLVLPSAWVTLKEKKRHMIAVGATGNMRERLVKGKIQEMRRGELKLFCREFSTWRLCDRVSEELCWTTGCGSARGVTM